MNHLQEKIDAILSASQKRFGRYGLSKTTMNEIAGDTGMSKASLYYYFKDKEGIFMAVNNKEQDDFVKKMKNAISADTEAKYMLTDYTKSRIILLQKLLTLGKFSNESYLEVKPMIRKCTSDFKKTEISLVADILKSGVKRKEFFITDIQASAELFIDILRGLRQARISGFFESGIFSIPAGEYQKLRKQSELFTAIFIKGLSSHYRK
jgi:TetR/AcrR family transcriptional regulator